MQGFSGIVSLGGNQFLTPTDNGFGNKLDSQDALMMVHHLTADWPKGTVTRQQTTFISDPDHKVPFFIQNENTTARYLTGSDFDPESIQIVGNEWWIGDEFGPYVLRVTPQGKVLGVVETIVGGKALKGPDHYLNGRLPNYPGDSSFEVRCSGGFESMAKSPDGKTFYPMFEWPLWDALTKAVESRNGRPYARILSHAVRFELVDNRPTFGGQFSPLQGLGMSGVGDGLCPLATSVPVIEGV